MSAYRSNGPSDDELARASRGLIRTERHDGGLLLQWRWFGWRRFSFWLFVTTTGGVCCAIAAQSVNIISVVGVAIAAVGVYVAIATLVNSTRVNVGAEISSRHGPLPWPGARSFPRDAITQLYVKEVVTGSGRGKDVKTYEYKVRARLTDGRDVLLVNGLLDARRAKALERVLELDLQITNERVKGEWG